MKTIDGKCIIPIKGIDYVLLTDYIKLFDDKEKLVKSLNFKDAYIKSLKTIIYKLYQNQGLSTLEYHTVLQSIEENGGKYAN